MAETFVGIDLETSAGNHDGRLIQVGVSLAMAPSENYVSYVRPDDWPDVLWEDGAAKVHGIPREVIEDAPTAKWVDRELADWLYGHGLGPRDCIAVGWNVASFDLPFVRRELPEVGTLFHYRAVDLNSLVFALHEGGKRYDQKARNYETWKKLSKRYAAEVIGGEAQWHDALYDAQASLLAFKWLAEQSPHRPAI